MDFIKSDGDFTTSTEKALNEIDPKWKKYPGVIVFGTHGFKDVEAKLELIRKARVNKIPFFGECGGLQLAVIEYARHVLGLTDANSTEIKPLCADPVVIKNHGGLRVGIRKVLDTYESMWHTYQVNPRYDWSGWKIVKDEEGVIAEMRLKNHPSFIGTQYHPSYGSSKDKPHKVLVEFIESCKRLSSRRGSSP